jgi:hypothetical protein
VKLELRKKETVDTAAYGHLTLIPSALSGLKPKFIKMLLSRKAVSGSEYLFSYRTMVQCMCGRGMKRRRRRQRRRGGGGIIRTLFDETGAFLCIN